MVVAWLEGVQIDAIEPIDLLSHFSCPLWTNALSGYGPAPSPRGRCATAHLWDSFKQTQVYSEG